MTKSAPFKQQAQQPTFANMEAKAESIRAMPNREDTFLNNSTDDVESLKRTGTSERIISIILAVMLLLTVINSTWFFLGIAKVSFIQWTVFNACAPSSIVYLTGLLLFYLRSDRKWLAIAVVPMMFFGTMGLFVFPWNSGTDLLVQFSHIIMTLNIAWGLYIILKNNDTRALAYGLLISVFAFIPFIAFTQSYCRVHAEEVMKYLNL